MSRENILNAIKNNQPELSPLQELPDFKSQFPDLVEQFTNVAVSIGAKVFEVTGIEQIKEIIQQEGKAKGRVVSNVPGFEDFAEVLNLPETAPHSLQNVDFAIVQAHLGVAENSACWINALSAAERVLPVICQHLAFVVRNNAIVATMHDAYLKIADVDYGYAAFIAGPSKTADIEQSLVLGAHGPRSLMVFLV